MENEVQLIYINIHISSYIPEWYSLPFYTNTHRKMKLNIYIIYIYLVTYQNIFFKNTHC